jgi:hypothetical protein
VVIIVVNTNVGKIIVTMVDIPHPKILNINRLYLYCLHFMYFVFYTHPHPSLFYKFLNNIKIYLNVYE